MSFNKQKFEKRESFTHLYAKKLLAEWLPYGLTIQIGNISNSVSAGNHFTHLEYPITKCYPNYIDECGCTQVNTDELNLNADELNYKSCEYRKHEIIESPCLKCLYLKDKILAVADIATAHKGMITDVFEIVNKNEDINRKLELYAELEKYGGDSYFISAQHILGQIQRPNLLHAIASTIRGTIYRD